MSDCTKNYSWLRKHELLKDTPLFIEQKSIDRIALAELSYSDLYIHDVIEISLVCSGHGIHRILNNDIPCSEGDIYFINADVPHGYFADTAGEELCVIRLLFDVGDWFDDSVSAEENADYCYGVFRDNTVISCARLTSQVKDEFEKYFQSIACELQERNDGWNGAIRALLSMLLIKSSRYINGAIKNIPTASKKDWNIASFAISRVMEDFENSNLTLELIADELFISPSHLSRVFKRLIGVSFSEYLRTVRIDRACRLLADSELNVEEIVPLCGLKDVPCFYRTFSACTHMPPNEYRTKQRENNTDEKKGNKFMIILSEISTQLQAGKAKIVKEMVQQAIDEGIHAETILKEGLVAGMNVVGEKFKNNQVFVPEVLVAARAMNQGAALLKPLLVSEGVQSLGKVCIGTVQGDLHDIGKNIVKMMLEGKGFEVVDLGTDVPAEAFVKAAVEQNCDIICCSALLTTTMGVMADVVKAAEAAGIRDKVKIMVGGAPVSQEFADQINADVYSVDAASCANIAVELMSGK